MRKVGIEPRPPGFESDAPPTEQYGVLTSLQATNSNPARELHMSDTFQTRTAALFVKDARSPASSPAPQGVRVCLSGHCVTQRIWPKVRGVPLR